MECICISAQRCTFYSFYHLLSFVQYLSNSDVWKHFCHPNPNRWLKESPRRGRYRIYGLLAKQENWIYVHFPPSNSEEDVFSRCAPPLSSVCSNCSRSPLNICVHLTGFTVPSVWAANRRTTDVGSDSFVVSAPLLHNNRTTSKPSASDTDGSADTAGKSPGRNTLKITSTSGAGAWNY